MKKILLLLAFGTSLIFAECTVQKDADRMTGITSFHITCGKKGGTENIAIMGIKRENGVLKFNSLILVLKDDAPKIFFQQKYKSQSERKKIRIKFNKDAPIVGEADIVGDKKEDFASGFFLFDDREIKISEPLEKLLIEYHNTSANLEYLELDISELNDLIK